MECTRKQNGLPPVVNVLLIALTKYWSARVASHQPAFIGSCLTICHTFLPHLTSEKICPCVSGVIE